MKRLIVGAALTILSSFGLMAQKSETEILLATMLPANEVPALTDTSSGNAIIWIHAIMDADGKPVSGSIDFDITTRFSGAVTVTGLHIHNAAAGVNGAIVIPTDVNGTDKSISIDATGRLRIQKQVQIPSTTPAISLATVGDMINNPQNYYVNIHTTANPGGAMRGQLLETEGTLLMGLMSTRNEVPAVQLNSSGVANVLVLRGRDNTGAVRAAAAFFNLDYTGFDPATIFTGFHIHNGAAGINGPVVINTGLSNANTITVDPSGAGNLQYLVHMSPLDANFATEVATVNSLFTTPNQQYINIHSTLFPGGVMRDQLRTVEEGNFSFNMLPSNENPPIAGLTANAQTSVPFFILRNADGTIAAGAMAFDVNYRGFPAGTTFTGLHLHEGAAGANGPVLFPSGVDANANKIVSDSGNGNIFKIVNISTPAAVAALNRLYANPNGFYGNLHTTVNAGGAVRAQIAPALARPVVQSILNNASPVTLVSPGAVAAIYGSNLSPVYSGLDGFMGLKSLPTSMNGVSVTIGGVKAPLYAVTQNQINVQVPFEVPVGPQAVVVTNSAGASVSINAAVASNSPSLFDLDGRGLTAVVKNADFSLITPQNRAKPGDVIVIYLTGLGQTTPPVVTGALVEPPSGGFNNTGTVTVTIGGISAPVAYSIASPNFAGLYQIAVTVPAGVSGPAAPLQVIMGTQRSNQLPLSIQ